MIQGKSVIGQEIFILIENKKGEIDTPEIKTVSEADTKESVHARDHHIIMIHCGIDPGKDLGRDDLKTRAIIAIKIGTETMETIIKDTETLVSQGVKNMISIRTR
uniref:Uncharacterized protein LOC114329235 n=1 Tax=Diabrotica virgifera virgifera TaxID=50390 RepID=A0A6P7FM63_DIAVI